MHQLVCGRDAEIAEWVADRIEWGAGGQFEPGTPAIGVFNRHGRMLAGVVYHDYEPTFRTMQITMAADNPMWARRDNIRGLLAYPFRQLGVFKVWVATLHTHTHGIKTFEHIGFKREAILAHQFGRKQHAWIGRMLQPDFTRLYEDA